MKVTNASDGINKKEVDIWRKYYHLKWEHSNASDTHFYIYYINLIAPETKVFHRLVYLFYDDMYYMFSVAVSCYHPTFTLFCTLRMEISFKMVKNKQKVEFQKRCVSINPNLLTKKIIHRTWFLQYTLSDSVLLWSVSRGTKDGRKSDKFVLPKRCPGWRRINSFVFTNIAARHLMHLIHIFQRK